MSVDSPARAAVLAVRDEVANVVVGQDATLSGLLSATEGHEPSAAGESASGTRSRGVPEPSAGADQTSAWPGPRGTP